MPSGKAKSTSKRSTKSKTRKLIENSGDSSIDNQRDVTQVPDIKTLVFGGGGTAGYCYVGAISVLFDETDESKPLLENVQNFIGTSIGAVIATVLSSTKDQKYLMDMFEKFKASDLLDNSCGVLLDIWRLYSKYGYNKGEYALKAARKVMKDLTGLPNITFEQHYTMTKKNLIITGTNTTTRQIVYFNRLTHPNMEVALAVRISMSLPLVFVPITYENERFTNILGTHGMYIDGGVIDNLPAHFVLTDLFRLLNQTNRVTDGELMEALMALYRLEDRFDCSDMTEHESEEHRRIQLNQTIAIKALSKESITNISPNSGLPSENANSNIINYCDNLISILMDVGLKRHITTDIWDRTLKIDIGDISTMDFDITKDDIQNMLRIGRESAINFLNDQ